MDKRLRTYFIGLIIVWSLLLILFILYLGGLNIQGRNFERSIILLLLILSILGIQRSYVVKDNIVRTRILRLFFYPLGLSILMLLASPILFANFSIQILNQTFSNEIVVYKDEKFKVTSGHSMMTEDVFELTSELSIFDKCEGKFQCDCSFENVKLSIDDKYVFLIGEYGIDSVEIIK